MIAANVGGIPEIFGPYSAALFTPNQPAAMADAIKAARDNPTATQDRAAALRDRTFVHFSQNAMVEGVLAGYRDAFLAAGATVRSPRLVATDC
jgi:glycosyltransferase involved in cell wall biosynthesis